MNNAGSSVPISIGAGVWGLAVGRGVGSGVSSLVGLGVYTGSGLRHECIKRVSF